MKVWAFNGIGDQQATNLVYQSVKNGKSRFGWGSKDEDDLRKSWIKSHGKQAFLKDIEKGDWIVHVNMPVWGKCVAVQVTKEYDFDEGLLCNWGSDVFEPEFRHFLEVDMSSIVEFNRRDENIHPSVNLRPMKRCQRIYAVNEFLKSLESLKQNKVTLQNGETKNIFHLRDETNKLLKEITASIHASHKGKDLERFFAEVFKKISGVVNVDANGFGWKSDHGADLIVTTNVLGFENKIVVQIKSFSGEHHDLTAVSQIKTAIEKYEASLGMIITTAEKTSQLEAKIQDVSEEMDCQINLLAGDDVAKFVLKYAPELLFRL